MGFFDKLKGGFAFNKMAKAYKETLDCLNVYSFNRDVRYVYKAAWIFSNCIIAGIKKWHWNMFAGIMIPDYKMYGRITLQEINMIVSGKLGTISQCLSAEENAIIERIMDGESIKEVESLISISEKEKFMP